MVLKRKNRTLVDIIFANRKNTLIFAAAIIGLSFFLVESAKTFTWDQMVWAYVVISIILVVSGKKELEETRGDLTKEEASELLFGDGGLLEQEQKLNRNISYSWGVITRLGSKINFLSIWKRMLA